MKMKIIVRFNENITSVLWIISQRGHETIKINRVREKLENVADLIQDECTSPCANTDAFYEPSIKFSFSIRLPGGKVVFIMIGTEFSLAQLISRT